MSEDFIPCERTVRLCIEALAAPNASLDIHGSTNRERVAARKTLEAFLPDPAKALAQSIWEGFGGH